MPVCPRCQQEITSSDKFCPHCGHQLREAFPGMNITTEESGITSVPGGGETRAGTDYQVEPGRYVKQGWELFKQYIPGFVGFVLLVLLIQLILQAVGWLGQLVSIIITGPLGAGWYIVSAKLLQRQTVQFGDFFAGFRYFLPLVLYTVVASLLIMLGFVLLIIPGVYLLVSYTFATLLILDRRLDFWQAMETSRKTVQRHWFGIFVFLLLLLLLNLGGALLLGVGLLVTIPWSMCAITVAFHEIFGLQATSY